ncbi:MAG: nuclear transport factor 2 family protein [Actinomycetota bacterium]
MPPTADADALLALVRAYAAACDARDADALRRCFTTGATLTVHWSDRPASTLVLPDAAGPITHSLGRYDRTDHVVGDHRAEIDGDTATGVTHCVAHHVHGATDHVMTIRYLDRYRRTPGGWRIETRDLHEDRAETRPVDD